jgi:hypothetical protein
MNILGNTDWQSIQDLTLGRFFKVEENIRFSKRTRLFTIVGLGPAFRLCLFRLPRVAPFKCKNTDVDGMEVHLPRRDSNAIFKLVSQHTIHWTLF